MEDLFIHNFIDNCHRKLFDFFTIFYDSTREYKNTLNMIHHHIHSPEDHRQWDRDRYNENGKCYIEYIEWIEYHDKEVKK